jgi:BASS family bile acid:Na+ symporter
MTVDEQVLAALFTGGLTVAILATVLSLGMSFSVAQLLVPIRRVRLVVAMLILNAVVLPALAWRMGTALPVSRGHAGGIALAAIGSAGAAGLKAAQLSRRADLPLAVWLVVVLQLANLVAVPLWASVVVTGPALSRLTILRSLVVLVLLPLAGGAIVRVTSPEFAGRMRPPLLRVANVALIVALAAGIAANRAILLSVLASWVLPAALAITGLGLGLGLLVGLPDEPTSVTTSLVSGTRFSALGLLIVGAQQLEGSEYLASAITFALVDVIVLLGVAVAIRPDGPWRRRRPLRR